MVFLLTGAWARHVEVAGPRCRARHWQPLARVPGKPEDERGGGLRRAARLGATQLTLVAAGWVWRCAAHRQPAWQTGQGVEGQRIRRGGARDQAWRSMAWRDVGCCGATGLAGWSGRGVETGGSGQEVGGEQAAAMHVAARVEVESGYEG